MGCGESTGKDTESTTIEFKTTDVKSVDNLFGDAKDLVETLTSFQSSLEDQKDKFYEATGFEFAPGAKPKHAFNGMYLCLASTTQGDMDALKADWKADAPFAYVDVSNLDGPTQNIYNSFVDYANALADILAKLPDALEKAEAIVSKAEGIQDAAEKEFDELDMMKKAKAVMFTGKNVMAASKLPKAVQESIDSTKAELELLKEAVEEVKTNMPKLPEQGKTCSDAEIKDCVPCYKKIHGDIPCTPEEREAWVKKMTAVMKKRNKPFNPEDY